MSRIAKIRIFLFLGIVIFSSCGKTVNSQARLFMAHKWVLNSYINYSLNQEMPMPTTIYAFNKDGSVEKVCTNDTVISLWQVLGDDYVTIDNTTYKIAEISRKIMVLRFGKLDFIYRPVR